MTNFLSGVENILVNDRIKRVLGLPLQPPTPPAQGDPGADLHIRIPKSLADELQAIAAAYPTTRNNLVRVFLLTMVQEWREQQRLALEKIKPTVERAQARKLGAGRRK